MSNDVKRVVDRIFAAAKRRSYTEAVLGRPNVADGTISYAVPERPGFVHVRIGSGGSLTPDIARNVGKRAVAHRPHLPILLVRENGDWVIEGENTNSGLLDDDDGSNNGPYGVPPHPHDDLYFRESEFIDASTGVDDAGKPVKTDAAGLINSSLFDSSTFVMTTGDQSVGGLKVFTALLTASLGLLSPDVWGSAASGGNLTLHSTSDATKGFIYFGTHGAYDQVNGRFGFGTLTPGSLGTFFASGASAVLRVESDGSFADMLLRGYRESAATHARFVGSAARGSLATPAALQADDQIFALGGNGYHGSGAFGSTNNFFEYLANENFASGAQGTKLIFYTVANGGTVRGQRMEVDTSGIAVSGYVTTSGDKRVSTQFDKTNTTLASVTGLSANVSGGLTYEFEATLYVDANATGGHKYAISGTATATAIIYEVVSISNTTGLHVITSRQTALGGAGVGQAGATVIYTIIKGTITVNAGGTILVQFAQNAASGTSSILVGSTFIVKRIP